jgi:hypothetical protein
MSETLEHNPEDSKREKNRQELLEKLRGLMEWSEEIPEEKVPTKGQESFLKYKVKISWFTNVLLWAELAKNARLLSQNSSDRYYELKRKFDTSEFRNRNHTREDIEEMNQFLQDVIYELEGNQDGRV